jgi:diguanylate cyclase (GGDEF)-like protein
MLIFIEFPVRRMARTPLRKRILSTTIIYSVMLIGIVFILTWRTHDTQREIERIVLLQTRATEALNRFKVFHAGLQATWTRAGEQSPDALVSAADRYLTLAGQYRAELARATAVPHELATESERLDRLASGIRDRHEEMKGSDRSAALAALEGQTRQIVALTDDAIVAANGEINRRMQALVRDGRNTMWTALGAAWIIVVIGLAIARNALKKVVRPLEELFRAANAIADEQYEKRAPVGGDREIAELGVAFNQMAARIQATVAAKEHTARTDDLTNLPNFRAFSEMIDEEIVRSGRYEQHFGLLIFDIDHFKKYNDSYGHLAGNEALQLVATTIRGTLRTVDRAARYGGEEFAAILPQVDEEAMHIIGDRARRAVQNLLPIADRRRLTVSIGGAIFPRDGRTADALFQAADKRLYEAKEKGRNMVVTPAPSQLKRA